MKLLLLADNNALGRASQNLADRLVERVAAFDDGQRDGIRILLVGFDHAALIDVRRRLAAWLSERHVHTLSFASEQRLAAVTTSLVETVVARWVAGQGPARLEHLVAEGRDGRFAALRGASSASFKALPGGDGEEKVRPTLALVSPMPPQPTGIACYSAELLPYLTRHFRVSLVVDQPDLAPELRDGYDILDAEGFDAHAGDFDHVLYQVGNSLYHAYQFNLMRRHPGVVVLHDFFLFDAVWWLQESGVWPGALRQQLYRDHGYPGVLALDTVDNENPRGPEAFPVNGFVIREAAGLIYHSEFARRLGEQWRQGERDVVRVIPHLRELPDALDSDGARAALDVPHDELVIASFGGISPKKMTDTLVEAFLNSSLATHDGTRLVLVGAQHGGEFGQRLARRLRQHPAGNRVTITGYVERDCYTQWLAAADVAVQLRCQSRGETSGAIFDAMAHQAVVVANAHGTAAELPSEAIWLLPETPELEELSRVLEDLAEDEALRTELGNRAREYVSTTLSPERIAEQYRQAMFDAAREAPRHRREAWLDRLAATPGLLGALQGSPEEALDLSRPLVTLDTTSPAPGPRILFDVSTIAWHDLKTGIERVTRRLADHALRHPPEGWRVELIRWGGDDFYLARGFASEQLGLSKPPGPDVPVEARAGDIYVSVEWAPPLLEQAGHVMRRMRAEGVRFYFTVHDLLPLSLPSCFPAHIPATMRTWFTGITELADGITCVSRQVADEVRDALASAPPPWVGHFHLGADFSVRQESDESLEKEERTLHGAIARLDGPTLLMVGTVEPRKGHRQVVEALDLLWQDDVPINLVIVGKQGWDVEDLVRHIKHHPRYRHRLFWLTGASDGLLERLYADSDVLVAASLGEGFGLPLIEAAHHRIAILARDIPVFREVAGEFAEYFQGDSPTALAEALDDWRQRWRRGDIVESAGMPYQNWSQSAQQWMGEILADPALRHPGGTS